MAKTIAKLIKGEDYYILGVKFTNGKEVEVDKKLREHLVDNPQFEVTEVETEDEKQNEDRKDSKGAKNKQEGDK